MERLQREYGSARFVKAFNSVGNALMVNPALTGGPPTMFICGNDQDAKRIVKASLGGGLPGFLRNEWTHAFKVLR